MVCKPQADERQVSDEEFGESLEGEVIFQAQAAFYEELVTFFQGLRRGDLAKALTAQLRMITLAVAKVEGVLDGLDLEAELAKTLGKLSTSSPEPSDSSPES